MCIGIYVHIHSKICVYIYIDQALEGGLRLSSMGKRKHFCELKISGKINVCLSSGILPSDLLFPVAHLYRVSSNFLVAVRSGAAELEGRGA